MTSGQSENFSHISRQWLESGTEPALDELLADPLVHLMMRRDSVSMAELCNHIATGRTRLGFARASAKVRAARPE